MWPRKSCGECATPKSTVTGSSEEQAGAQAAPCSTNATSMYKGDAAQAQLPADSEPDKPAAQSAKNVMRPKEFDGKEPINSYLAHVRVCAEFNKWTEEEKGSWLKWSLKDRARQALWDESSSSSMSFAELEKTLRSGFGSEHQREIYKMELEGRRRRPNEFLSDLMQDVRRLMVLGYGNEQGPMWESVAIKCFLSALDDPHLAVEIRKQRPYTLDATYQESLLLDGCYRTGQGERGDGDSGKKKEQARSTRVDKGQSRQERGWQREVLAAQQSTTCTRPHL